MSTSTDAERSVYVGNVDPQVTEELLYELFTQLGPVTGIRYPKDKVQQTYQGFAFVEFAAPRDQEYVLQLAARTKGKVARLYDKWLNVRQVGENSGSSGKATGAADKVAGNVDDMPLAKVLISNLSDTTETKTLSRIVSKLGKVYRPIERFSSGASITDAQDSCYVFFNYYRDADKAIAQLNDTHVGNTRVSVAFAPRPAGQKGHYGTAVDRRLNSEAEKHGLI